MLIALLHDCAQAGEAPWAGVVMGLGFLAFGAFIVYNMTRGDR